MPMSEEKMAQQVHRPAQGSVLQAQAVNSSFTVLQATPGPEFGDIHVFITKPTAILCPELDGSPAGLFQHTWQFHGEEGL